MEIMKSKFRLVENKLFVKQTNVVNVTSDPYMFRDKKYSVLLWRDIYYRDTCLIPAWFPVHQFSTDDLSEAKKIYLEFINDYKLQSDADRDGYEICSQDTVS